MLSRPPHDAAVSVSTSASGMLHTYWHTLRYLKPVQFYGRLWFKYRPVRANLRAAPPLRAQSGTWVPPPGRDSSLHGETVFCFLSETHDLDALLGWDDPSVSKLWRYNLHYFDTLGATGAAQRQAQHQRLLARWIRENPPGQGSGWEPYPISIRVVNWIKYALAGNALSLIELNSMATQLRWLSCRLEIHLLGNHLFANAKALIFAGLFFSGPEAQHWLVTGLRILAKEVPEQILSDGGQFERSTMYHALALEDMLDLCNISEAFGDGLDAHAHVQASNWHTLIAPMRAWLATMSHPDRHIGFFNDAAFGIALSPDQLECYAGRLGLGATRLLHGGVHRLADSGYVRIQHQDAVVLLDVGPIGPDYLPGHAHADTLSFELSLFGQRTVVNSGTSEYGLGAERLRQRGTSAHNTVTLDQHNSSEVWSGFRVARRARTMQLKIAEYGSMASVSCTHNGYRRLPGKNLHQRTWIVTPGQLEVHDEVTGTYGQAEAYFHLHPSVSVMPGSTTRKCRLRLPEGQEIDFSIDDGTLAVQASTWHPYFGRALDATCLVLRFSGQKIVSKIGWS